MIESRCIIVVVRGAGERVKMKVSPNTPIKSIIAHVAKEKGKVGELIKNGEYIVSSKTGAIRNLELTLVSDLKSLESNG